MSPKASTPPEANGRHRGRAILLTTGALAIVLTGAAAVAAFDPGTAVATRSLSRIDPTLEAAPEQRVRLTAEGQSASTVGARSHDTGWGTAIQIIVERPRPALQSVSIRLGTNALGVAPDQVMLATPGGDWPPLTYGATDGGDVTVSAEGIDWTSTTQLWLHLPATGNGDGQPSEINIAIDLEQASTPSLVSWTGSTTFDLALGGAAN